MQALLSFDVGPLNNVFKKQLGPSDRSLVSELRDVSETATLFAGVEGGIGHDNFPGPQCENLRRRSLSASIKILLPRRFSW